MKKKFPAVVVLCFAAAAAFQLLSYFGARALLAVLPERVPFDMTTALDRMIPLSPPWILVYFGAYASWIAGLFLILTAGRARAVRVTFAYMLALAVCGICFVLLPCTLVRPEIEGRGFFPEAMRFLYQADSPTNLFPSIHVLASWFCFRGMTGCPKISRAVKTVFFALFVLVSLSTLFVKQHVIADIPSAVFLGEACFLASRLVRPERILHRSRQPASFISSAPEGKQTS